MVLGYLHRSMEKLAEERTYTQNIPFTDRMDYLAAMTGNLGYCLAVEKLAGIEVPERGQLPARDLRRAAAHRLATAWPAARSSTTAAPGRRPSCTCSASARRSSTCSR